MPSLTEYFGHTITNFGPLTTTFTAPSSCATETPGRVFFGNASNLSRQYGNPECLGGYVGNCIPSGSAYDDYVTSYWKSPMQAWYPYFSPGVVCPSGWSTVGTLARAENTGSFDEGGVFTQDPLAGYPTRVRPWIGPDEVWSNALKPSETVAYCCPSGWTGSIGGGCYTNLGPHESFSYESVCKAYFPPGGIVTVNTVEGTAVTLGVYSVAQVTEAYSTSTAAITDVMEEEAWGDWAVGSVYPAVVLVYQETDVAKAKEQGEDESEDKGEDKGDDDNAASTLSAARGIVPVLAVAVSVLAGAGLLMPW
ncbi:hypothetical protein N0V84_004843 [Fusarium piperis]|uniref:Uncharacterized protein n=1 Tax=Fusarium piperis TaxID=1435070 RepID=A0A9W9BQT2_9HYPO|nr:hypothetical protein N0V84_004843 [Fusarium piperis]